MLGLLAFINLLSYVNRSVVFALFEPIKLELHLTDANLGWLASAYVLVFSLAALPFGMISDLRSRRAVIASSVTLWSTSTVLSGFVAGFGPLLACRAAVGLGGAAYGAASQSLVADFYPGRRRALAMGIWAAGIALGGVAGIWLGGRLEAAYGWRMALVAVGLPGFAFAFLAGRLTDPTRATIPASLRQYLREIEVGLTTLVRQFLPSLVGLLAGGVAAVWLDRAYGADSKLDIAAFGAAAALGLAANIIRWVRQIQSNRLADTPFGGHVGSVFEEIVHASRTVFSTPTLMYVFAGGALISFGMNGIVGWAPTFMGRELGLTAREATTLLGKWGLIFGTAGTVFGGVLGDWLRRYTPTGRVLAVSLGLLIGGPLAVWLLTIRDLSLFVPVFCIAFFFLTWFNGPIAAVIFDVAPARISATVIGAHLFFIHLAGDAISFPLVGMLSDRFGLANAVLVLPLVAIAGGLVVLGAVRTVVGDMARIAPANPA